MVIFETGLSMSRMEVGSEGWADAARDMTGLVLLDTLSSPALAGHSRFHQLRPGCPLAGR